MDAAPGIVAIVLVTVATLALGAYGLRFSRTTSDFMVASRAVGPRMNASAISGEYLSAASFLGVAGLLLGLASLACLSLGTLGQRWIGTRTDPIWSATLQCAVCVPPLLVLALAVEGAPSVTSGVDATVAVLWLAGVNSVLGLLLLGLLVRRGGAGASASVFFLMPPVTAVLAWVLLDERLTGLAVLGLALSTVGVAVATRRRA